MLFWLSLGTLLLAFVLGAVAALAALAVVVYKVLCGLPGHHARVVQVRFGAPEEPAGRPSTAQGDGATDTQEAESARWFNDLVGALVSSMVGNGTFQTFVALRLERSVNKDRPTFVSPIRITSHNLDMVACPTVAAVRSQRDATGAHQLRGRFQLAWSGDLTVCVATELLVLGKALPLTGRIRLTSLRGDAAYTLGRGPDPLLVLGFERPPVLGCHVDTDIGSSLSIANLPRVGAYLASRVEALIGDELLLPGGGLVLHTPIPHVRSMRPMLKAKFDRKPKSPWKAPDKVEARLSRLRLQQDSSSARVSASSSPATGSPALGRRSQGPSPSEVDGGESSRTAAPAAAPPLPRSSEDETIGSRFGRWTDAASRGIFALIGDEKEAAKDADGARAEPGDASAARRPVKLQFEIE